MQTETSSTKPEGAVSDADAKLLESTQALIGKITMYRLARLQSKIKAWPKVNTYASSIPTCARQGVYEIVAWDQKKLHDVKLQARFEEGERQEAWVIAELNAMGPSLGFRVVETQVPLSKDMTDSYHLSGRIDGKIEFDDRKHRIPFEVKSMNPLFFDKVNTVDDLTHDVFLSRYYRQMLAYMLGHQEPLCVLIITNCLGAWKFIVVPLDYQAAEDQVLHTLDVINQYVRENKEHKTTSENWILPDRIEYDVDVCGKCAFSHICLPDVVNASRVRFANDAELAANVARHEEIKPVKAEYEKIHETLKEYFADKKVPLIVIGDAPSFIVSGKPTKGRDSLAPPEEWAPDERETFEKLKKKYSDKTPGWSFKITRQNDKPKEEGEE